ncbi:MraY family glycosyltransferase [Bacteroides fluxus]|mgnify:FL=1|uniref:Glycosyltransferase, group 4 family n=1 Tax=Bacteroides fluxus YIT 12057 TaxID=763034 RepID=F3PXM0_9BACE|nr:MraY family glycosyltransferase [Bacteroides fluxus]EGF51602.1 glycosyltransferase, group 4 family [Bacteroides fluxus YIT 12057]
MIYNLELGVAFLAGCLFSAMVIPRISLVAFKLRLFDPMNSRKIHTECIPRLGGVAFFPCIIVAVSLTIVFHSLCLDDDLFGGELTIRFLALCSALFILYLMGVMDDLVGVRYRSKFVVQTLCGLLMAFAGCYFNNLYGLFGIHEIPGYVGIPFTVLIIVYILNAVNLIDGIDGLASGLGMIAFLAFGCLFVYLHRWMYALLAFASLGVLVPFFYYNVFGQTRRGRKLFMGDTGSLTIGMLLAVMAIRLSMFDPVKERLLPGSIVVAFSFLMVPMLDVVRVVLHRMRKRKPLFSPDKNHIHHKFMALGMPQHRAMLCIVGIAVGFTVLNVCAIHYLSVTVLFLLNVAAWTVMHFCITGKILKNNRKNHIKD